MAINMGTAIAYLELDTSKFSKGFSSAFKDLKVFGDKTAKVDSKLKGLQSAFGTVGSTLSKNVTLPIAGIGAAALKSGTDFESAMSEVKAISGATGSEFDALRDKAIKMGAKTKFSASDSAKAFKYMAMAGWDASQMMDGIAGVMDLAAASGEDLATTSDIVTDALTAFGLQASDSAHFADVLAQASSKSNTNVGLMGETFKYVAPVAGAMGYSIEDTAVAIGLMANAGIKGSQAGTALRSTITRLVKPTKESGTAMDALGISVTNSDGSMKSLDDVLRQVRSSMSELTEDQKASYAAMLAGQEGMSGLLAIVNASDEDFQKLTDEINNANGAAQDMADIMMNNTAGAIEQLKGALESTGILIGEQLTPYIRQLAESITGLVEKFNSLSEKEQEQIVKFGLILAAIGPLFLIISKLIGMIKTTISVFKFLAFAITTPVGGIVAIIAVIGAFVAALMYMWKNSETFRNYWINVWNTIKETVISAWESIKSAFEAVKTFFTKTIPETFNSFVEFISGIVQSVIEFFTVTIPEAFINFATITVPQFIEDVHTFFKELPYKLGFVIGQVIGNIYLWAVEMKEKAKETGEQFVENVVTFFKELPEKISNFVKQIIENVSQWASDMKQKAIEIGTNFIESVITFFQELPGKVYNFITDTFKKISKWGSEMKQKAIEIGTNFLNSIVNFFSQLPGKIWSFISSIPDKIRGIGASLKQAGKDIFNKLLDGIKSVAQNIVDFVKGIAETIKNFVDGIKEGFKSVVDGASEAGNATKSVGGSHANGLSYVPYNGYVARLHEGERVLTKQQNKEYNERNAGQGGDTFNFYNTQPTPYEYARQMKKAKEELLYGL